MVEKTQFHKTQTLAAATSIMRDTPSPAVDAKRHPYLPRGSNLLAETSLRLADTSQLSDGRPLLHLGDFYKKYESQRVKWERLKNSPAVNHDLAVEERELEAATFRPEINERSKNLVRGDHDRIENRVKILNEGRERKIKELQEMVQTQYPYKPAINKRSEEIMKGRTSTILCRSPLNEKPKPAISPIARSGHQANSKNDKI